MIDDRRGRAISRRIAMVKLSVLCHRANAHADEVWSLAWSRGASDARARLVTGSLDESVKRWGGDDDGDALDDLRDAHAYTGHALGVCALDANARGMVAASALDGVVRAWDAETGETLAAIEGAPGESWGVKFDPSDASTLLAIGGGTSQSVRVHDASDGTRKQTLELPATTAEKPRNGRFVQSVAYSPDGKRIACGATDGTVGVFDVKTGKCVHTLAGHVAPVRDVAFAPDGKTLYTACDDGYAHVYDAQNKSLIESLSGHKSWVLSVTASPDGTALVTGSSDATIKLWDLKTRSCAQTMTDHTDAVWCVRFSRDGAALAAASADRSVSLFNFV